jgi:putative ATPase
MRLFVLTPLAPADVRTLLDRALATDKELVQREVFFTPDALDAVAEMSEGDARLALGLLDSIAAVIAESRVRSADDVPSGTVTSPLAAPDLARLIQHRAVRYDKRGEEHFNLISALHKSLRNSDVQAGLYWLTRMLEGGEDPLYIARRLVRFASEDVGLADPQALVQALAARDAVHFIGLPEGALALAQVTVYLALAPKSNRLYTAYQATDREVRSGYNPGVPLSLRNAPTRLMKEYGYGNGYVYAPDTTDGIAALTCLPRDLATKVFYRPSRAGFEAELRDRMDKIAAWHRRRQAKAAKPEGPEEPGGNR